jgi:Putative DNA-binding domain
MPALLELQRSFANALRTGDVPTSLEALQIADSNVPERFGVHAGTRLATLIRTLSLVFPAVQRLVGADFFEAAAREFIRLSPPECACLDDYGARFPWFVQGFEPAAQLPYLPDVARLEWAVSRALHALDATALDVSRLVALGSAELAEVRFVAHPSISLLQLSSPADAIWRAVLEQDAAAMAAVDPGEGPIFLLIERGADGIQVRRLSGGAWHLTQRLCAGEPLHAALEDLQAEESAEGPARDAIDALLADHLLWGRFIDVVSATGAPRS